MQSGEKNAQPWLGKMQERWGLETTRQVLVVLAVFSLAGSSVVWFRKGLFYLLGYDDLTPMWLKTITYIIFIFPTYQTLLLAYGFLLGQFSFFWEKEKKMFRWIAAKFKGKK
ncbi:hypothetical protein DYBT9623_04677 [Dyadobacter sp. CECT 9623]|uniref:DUF6787 domain-containing protein n=1 Tax=Dyadobacter linearis TaxID=2823330 RepID=A0ABM8UXB9_9BACT|nr:MULTISPECIES: DUF6787 family protein [unclassified Dyadobacter]MCE7063440.1 hypothetical protein [Dyadobacter sp. CY343]CAG5073174.1 hypothetical protein DYBT9623_04677 [Dyadobacter sp. CECT 9623]